jgi:hypothetical protein
MLGHAPNSHSIPSLQVFALDLTATEGRSCPTTKKLAPKKSDPTQLPQAPPSTSELSNGQHRSGTEASPSPPPPPPPPPRVPPAQAPTPVGWKNANEVAKCSFPSRMISPRPSNRRDLDMVAQRMSRLKERIVQRKLQDAAVADYHNFVVKQRGFQMRASHMLLAESQMFQSAKQKKRAPLPQSMDPRPSPGPFKRTATRSAVPQSEETAKFSPTWYRLVRDDISLLLFDQQRNYCSTVRQQLAEFYLFG